ncbi:hypothetical protein RND81_05G028300 [Saponaria officinalis]|uniref:DUF1985 domain-containing protein n=1 Tax=Saponaria officinalis TaxID=3572 RepID=A0AAW1KWW6_SAPOF
MVKLTVKGPSSSKSVDSKQKFTSSQSPSTRKTLTRNALKARQEEKVCKVVKKHKVEKADDYVKRCRPSSLFSLIPNLSEDQKEAVRQIGFGGLLHLKLSSIPQMMFGEFLYAFRNETFFEISESEKFKLSEDDVCDVFGLPNGGRDLELVLTGLGSSSASDVDSLKSLWRKKYGIAGNKDPIPLSAVKKKLTECRESGDEFKRTFVLFAMSSFLAPTSGSVVDFRLVSAVEDVSMINQLNWCKFVFIELVAGVREAVRGARYVRGCMVLLAIAHFHRYAVSFDKVSNELPLIQHWSDTRFIERLKHEQASGGLGHGVRSDTVFPISRKNPCGSAEGVEGSSGSTKPFPDDRFILVKLPADIRTDEEVKSASLDVSRLYLFSKLLLLLLCYCVIS